MKKIVTGILTTYILFVNTSIAAPSPGKLQLNGQPFQLLNESIQENSGAISALSTRVSTIEGDIATINNDISSLDTRITTNTADISSALEKTDTLSDDLDALSALHTVDFATLSGDIAIINGSIAGLEASILTLRNDLQTELDALGDDLSDLDAQTAGQISGLEGQIATLSGSLSTAQGRLSDLETAQTSLLTAIAGLELRANAMAGRITTLEGLHITHPAVCVEGNDTGTGAPYVVCEADENQAWISANNTGGYHAELICQELGYTTVSLWSGTCGNICGYCQAATSCTNPGSGPEIEGRSWDAFNHGTDELGRKIGATVQWRCVK